MENQPVSTDLAQEIVATELRQPVSAVERLTGSGIVNSVFRVRMAERSVIARLNTTESLRQFQKEAWCIAEATRLGVPTAAVLGIGQRDSSAFLILEDVGRTSASMVPDPNDVWNTLGAHAQLIHTIHTHGLGDNMVSPGVFDEDWTNFLDDNLKALASPEHLAGAVHHDVAKRLYELASILRDADIRFGLAHGDLSLKNTIVNDRDVSIVDWGSAEAQVVPHYDLSEILKSSFDLDPASSGFQTFLRGYGIDESKQRSLVTELNALLVIKAVNKLRWAMDRAPSRADHYRIYLRSISEYVLG
jgi:tRNA A-37 threonylcarbamoyl transferase component Bud32